MKTRRWNRLRAFVALAIFATSGGGTQLLDALVFHRSPARPDVVRVNAPDRCHSENCELGSPIAISPPEHPRLAAPRIQPEHRVAPILAPQDAPRTPFVTGSLGSRAPPVHS